MPQAARSILQTALWGGESFIRSMSEQSMKKSPWSPLIFTHRKCMDWETPIEVLREKMMDELRANRGPTQCRKPHLN